MDIKYHIAVVVERMIDFKTWSREFNSISGSITKRNSSSLIDGEFRYFAVGTEEQIRGNRIHGVIYLDESHWNKNISEIESSLHYALIC